MKPCSPASKVSSPPSARERRIHLTPSFLTALRLGLACALVLYSTAQALDIQLFDEGSVPMNAQQLAAFQKAADMWENKLGTPATVKVNIGFANLPNGVLGSTTPLMCTHSFTTIRNALVAKAESQTEENAIQMLPAGSLPITDINGQRSPNQMTVARANAKALGVGTGIDPQWGGAMPNDADGSIFFANAFANVFDFDPSDGIAPGKTDFVTVAAHEIGHLLGFMSVTDVQDYYPGYQLNPFPLDLWRFTQSGGAHDLTNEHRTVTAGPAEYYDCVLTNIPFSQGVLWNDPLCGCCGGGCQASHWQDSLLNQLMDPTLAPNESKGIHAHDAHALDYIGHIYPSFLIDPSKLKWLIPFDPWWEWKFPWCLTCPPFDFPADYPRPHEISNPPFAPNVGMIVALNLTMPGMETMKRSLSGVAIFQDARLNTQPALRGLPPVEGQMHLFPPPTQPDMLPPALMDLYLESDDVNGMPFTARATFSKSGAEFEPSLGRHGGYRITLAVDGMADGVVGDVDGTMTLELLADEGGVPNPDGQNVFGIDPASIDNRLEVLDVLALGFCQPCKPKMESEPNDGAAAANPIGAIGYVSVLGTIKGGDADYFRFTAPPNSKAWITVDTGGTQLAGANSRDSILTLFAADGVTVIERDNDDGSGNGADSTLESGDASAIAGRTLVAGGNYFLRVLAHQPADVIAPYRLYLTLTTGAVPAEIEANNSAATATSLVPPGVDVGVRSGTIGGHDLADYYKVSVAGPSMLHVSADGDPERDGVGTDVIVDLIHTDGVTVLFSANSSAAGFAADDPPAEGFPFRLKSAGTYYLRVKGPAGVVGTYHLMAAVCRTRPASLAVRSTRTGLVLDWPAELVEGRVQSSTDLQTWTDMNESPTMNGEQFSVEVPCDSTAKFFRLVTD